jgi:hypothetical protein
MQELKELKFKLARHLDKEIEAKQRTRDWALDRMIEADTNYRKMIVERAEKDETDKELRDYWLRKYLAYKKTKKNMDRQINELQQLLELTI